MPPEIIPDDEDYASEEDSDFAPDAAPAQADDASSDEESDAQEPPGQDVKKPKAKPAKRKRGEEEAEDAGFENSGDEAIIERGLKKARRKKKGANVEEEDEGGEGGLVKTRSMRAQEKVEKKPLDSTATSTIDVDALWQSMLAGTPIAKPPNPQKDADSSLLSPKLEQDKVVQGVTKDARSPSTLSDGPDAMIMIKRTYNFAGKVHTEQKLVPRSSAEAKLYLASQAESTSDTPTPTADQPRRPPRKARRSLFEPVTEGVKRTDLFFGARAGLGRVEEKQTEAVKLNTVQKSAMDWAGFVDKEGIAEELDQAGKSKGAYRARQEFLARVEGKKDEEARRARGLPV